MENTKSNAGWMAFLLLAGTQLCLAIATTAAAWTDGLDAAPLVALLGTLTGLGLARSRFRGFTAGLFATIYGAFLTGYVLGPQAMEEGSWMLRATTLVTRIGLFLGKVLSGGTSRDSLMFVVLVMALSWTLGVAAAWALFRRGRVWQAILPAGVALLLNTYYYNGPSNLQVYVGVYVLLTLLILARTRLYQHEVEWRAARVTFSPDLGFSFLKAGLLFALVVLAIAWAVPTSAASPGAATIWTHFTGPWRSVRENWGRLFASVKAYNQPAADLYSESLVLAGAVRLTNQPVIDVFAPQRGEWGRFYWRARVYDRYVDGRWTSAKNERWAFDPQDAGMPGISLLARSDVAVKFISNLPALNVLYTAAVPKWVSREAELEVIRGVERPVDVTLVRATSLLRRGESYDLLASVSTADETSLRAAGETYPGWVTSRYLQLPGTITPRTIALAQEITAGANTPFDRAQAITLWLRDNIRYNLEIEPPPAGVDPVDWFLFESREGYCNYYASAMVVMLRALGIPARMAAGFAEGRYDPESGAYRVTESDAHTWPEVYFPNYGWVEFEPTVSQSPIQRPAEPPAEDSSGNPSADPFDPSSNRDIPLGPQLDERLRESGSASNGLTSIFGRWARWLWVGLALAAALIVLGVAWWVVEYAGMSRPGGLLAVRAVAQGMRRLGLRLPGRLEPYVNVELTELSPVALAYGRLIRGARWLGLQPGESATPYERVEQFARALPAGREPARIIADAYVAERFGRQPGDGPAASLAWKSLRPLVWLGSLRRRLLGWWPEWPEINR